MVPRRLALPLVLVAFLAFAVPADAVLSGRNGRIAFTSGRIAGDATAQIFMVNPVTPSPIEGPFSIPMTENRHASFSPDRTKLVFAAGTPGSLATEQYDLFVRDFAAEPDTITPLDLVEATDNLSSDRPAWSPDGTRIAYEHQPTDNSTERNIMVKTFGTAAPATPLTTGAPIEGKPAWSADSQTIYYSQLNGTDTDIVREPAAG